MDEHVKYDEYIHSAEWATVRTRALRRAQFRCEWCGTKKKLQVHHRSYARLGNESPDDLQVLCKKCHEERHGKIYRPDGSTRSIGKRRQRRAKRLAKARRKIGAVPEAMAGRLMFRRYQLRDGQPVPVYDLVRSSRLLPIIQDNREAEAVTKRRRTTLENNAALVAGVVERWRKEHEATLARY